MTNGYTTPPFLKGKKKYFGGKNCVNCVHKDYCTINNSSKKTLLALLFFLWAHNSNFEALFLPIWTGIGLLISLDKMQYEDKKLLF